MSSSGTQSTPQPTERGTTERLRDARLRAQIKCLEVLTRAAELHSYDCPCLVVLDIAGGHAPFLDWIVAETSDG